MSFEFPLSDDFEWIRNNPEPDTANGTKMTEWVQWKMRHPFLKDNNVDWTRELELLLKKQDDHVAVQHPMNHSDKEERPLSKVLCSCSRQQLIRDGCKCGGI